MNCASYIENVSRCTGSIAATKGVMTELNDCLAHDLQDIEATLNLMSDDFKLLVETAVAVDQSYGEVSRESNEMSALKALKDEANKSVFIAASRFADNE